MIRHYLLRSSHLFKYRSSTSTRQQDIIWQNTFMKFNDTIGNAFFFLFFYVYTVAPPLLCMLFFHPLLFFPALCCRSFNDHTLIFLQTKRLAHRLRIILGLFGLKAAELHGDLTQLQVVCSWHVPCFNNIIIMVHILQWLFVPLKLVKIYKNHI